MLFRSYTVYTFVEINIPVLDKFLSQLGGIFSVTGETSLIYTAETPGIAFDKLISNNKCHGKSSVTTDTVPDTVIP